VGRGALHVVRDGLPLRRGELGVERVDGPVERLVEPLQREEPLEAELHHDAAAVGGVVGAPGVAGPGEPVDDPGDGAGAEAGGRGELPGGLRPARRQQREHLQVGARQPDAAGEDLLEEAGRLAELAQDEQQVIGAGGRVVGRA
jgi:hypothetical protein